MGQAQRYLDQLSEEQATASGRAFARMAVSAGDPPAVPHGDVRAGRLGIAVAARQGDFALGWALLTVLAAALVHLGINVANDVFDTASGADAANVTPTQFSGGSRVILYGLVSMRGMAWLSAGFFAGAIAIGLWLAVARGFWPLFWIGAAGVFIGVEYTAPPLRRVPERQGDRRGARFRPIMIWAHTSCRPALSWGKALYASLPVAILTALILYANEIPTGPVTLGSGSGRCRSRLKRTDHRRIPRIDRRHVRADRRRAVTLLLPVWTLAADHHPDGGGVADLDRYYDNPYELMPAVPRDERAAAPVRGLLLIAGYVGRS